MCLLLSCGSLPCPRCLATHGFGPAGNQTDCDWGEIAAGPVKPSTESLLDALIRAEKARSTTTTTTEAPEPGDWVIGVMLGVL